MKEITFDELTDRILCADPRELFQILDIARERFSQLFPSEELLTLTAEGSCPDAQIAALQRAISLLSSTKK